MKPTQFADGIIRIDTCLSCGRRHRAGSTAAFACARRVKKMIDDHPMPLMVDRDETPSERIGGTI